MSKEIFLYSGDNKYQAYVELADNTDRFGCPDHSFFKLIENRNDDKLYLIAEARDGLLETEKDQRIAELEKQLDQLKQQLEEKDKDLDLTTKTANELIEIKHKLEKQLEEKDKEIKRVTKIDNKTFLFETYEKPLREQIQLLKQQLVEKQSKIDEMSKEFVQAVHAVYDWRVLCAEKDKEIKKLNWQLKEKAIVVPVKLGDTIYVIPSETNYRLNIVNRREDRNKVYKYLVDEIRYNKYGFSIVCDVGDAQFYCNYEPPKNLCGHFDTEKYYGETWFITEQEAQEKLKEMKRNG